MLDFLNPLEDDDAFVDLAAFTVQAYFKKTGYAGSTGIKQACQHVTYRSSPRMTGSLALNNR